MKKNEKTLRINPVEMIIDNEKNFNHRKIMLWTVNNVHEFMNISSNSRERDTFCICTYRYDAIGKSKETNC